MAFLIDLKSFYLTKEAFDDKSFLNQRLSMTVVI